MAHEHQGDPADRWPAPPRPTELDPSATPQQVALAFGAGAEVVELLPESSPETIRAALELLTLCPVGSDDDAATFGARHAWLSLAYAEAAEAETASARRRAVKLSEDLPQPVCATCRWWKPDATREGAGACRVSAPPWPATAADDTCGSWAAR